MSLRTDGSVLMVELGAAQARSLGAFGIDVAQVLEVLEPSSVSSVPLAPEIVRGIMTHHGRIITVVDPAPLLGLPSQGAHVAQVVVLRDARRHGGNLGLQVKRIQRIVPGRELTELEVSGGPCVAWVAKHGQRVAHIVHVEALVGGLLREFGVESAARNEGVSL
jgi:chemotaxis signal transduction protein